MPGQLAMNGDDAGAGNGDNARLEAGRGLRKEIATFFRDAPCASGVLGVFVVGDLASNSEGSSTPVFRAGQEVFNAVHRLSSAHGGVMRLQRGRTVHDTIVLHARSPPQASVPASIGGGAGVSTPHANPQPHTPTPAVGPRDSKSDGQEDDSGTTMTMERETPDPSTSAGGQTPSSERRAANLRARATDAGPAWVCEALQIASLRGASIVVAFVCNVDAFFSEMHSSLDSMLSALAKTGGPAGLRTPPPSQMRSKILVVLSSTVDGETFDRRLAADEALVAKASSVHLQLSRPDRGLPSAKKQFKQTRLSCLSPVVLADNEELHRSVATASPLPRQAWSPVPTPGTVKGPRPVARRVSRSTSIEQEEQAGQADADTAVPAAIAVVPVLSDGTDPIVAEILESFVLYEWRAMNQICAALDGTVGVLSGDSADDSFPGGADAVAADDTGAGAVSPLENSASKELDTASILVKQTGNTPHEVQPTPFAGLSPTDQAEAREALEAPTATAATTTSASKPARSSPLMAPASAEGKRTPQAKEADKSAAVILPGSAIAKAMHPSPQWSPLSVSPSSTAGSTTGVEDTQVTMDGSTGTGTPVLSSGPPVRVRDKSLSDPHNEDVHHLQQERPLQEGLSWLHYMPGNADAFQRAVRVYSNHMASYWLYFSTATDRTVLERCFGPISPSTAAASARSSYYPATTATGLGGGAPDRLGAGATSCATDLVDYIGVHTEAFRAAVESFNMDRRPTITAATCAPVSTAMTDSDAASQQQGSSDNGATMGRASATTATEQPHTTYPAEFVFSAQMLALDTGLRQAMRHEVHTHEIQGREYCRYLLEWLLVNNVIPYVSEEVYNTIQWSQQQPQPEDEETKGASSTAVGEANGQPQVDSDDESAEMDPHSIGASTSGVVKTMERLWSLWDDMCSEYNNNAHGVWRDNEVLRLLAPPPVQVFDPSERKDEDSGADNSLGAFRKLILTQLQDAETKLVERIAVAERKAQKRVERRVAGLLQENAMMRETLATSNLEERDAMRQKLFDLEKDVRFLRSRNATLRSDLREMEARYHEALNMSSANEPKPTLDDAGVLTTATRANAQVSQRSTAAVSAAAVDTLSGPRGQHMHQPSQDTRARNKPQTGGDNLMERQRKVRFARGQQQQAQQQQQQQQLAASTTTLRSRDGSTANRGQRPQVAGGPRGEMVTDGEEDAVDKAQNAQVRLSQLLERMPSSDEQTVREAMDTMIELHRKTVTALTEDIGRLTEEMDSRRSSHTTADDGSVLVSKSGRGRGASGSMRSRTRGGKSSGRSPRAAGLAKRGEHMGSVSIADMLGAPRAYEPMIRVFLLCMGTAVLATILTLRWTGCSLFAP